MRIYGTNSDRSKPSDRSEPGMLEYYRAKNFTLRYAELESRNVFDPVLQKYDLKKITDGILAELREEGPDGALRRTFREKYHIDFADIQGLSDDGKCEAVCESVYNYLRDYEDSNELTSLTKKDFTHVMENLYMIYNTDDKEIQRVVQVIHLASQNIISKYIQIDGLERLFNEQYIDFEWEMHMGMDHQKQSMKFYRDHFVHQVRDAYMMDRLLNSGGFYRRIRDILCRPGASKVSQYFCKMVRRQKDHPLPNAEILAYDEEFIARNIIYMSAYMAGLFHDIGYPDTYLQSLRRRMFEFSPSINSENSFRDTLPDNIFSLLQNSLLFRVVPFEEIQARVYQDCIDHGTLSAIAFLLHFYKNGVIFMLPPYKAAAIELAALAIYNHTFVYGISRPKKNTDDYRPRFLTNPISYLLRICDDLQEWDRVYFEISGHSNLIICSRCHTPIVGQDLCPDDEESRQKRGERRPKEGCRRYVCNCYREKETDACGQRVGSFFRAFDGALALPYRRLYNIQTCDEVQVDGDDPTDLGHSNHIYFRLKYNSYKLLHIAYISSSYARYRIEELNRLKPLLMQQSGLPHMWLDYFVTANPILLKTRLLEEYFDGLDEEKKSRIKEILDRSKPTGEDSRALSQSANALVQLLEDTLEHYMGSSGDNTGLPEDTYTRIGQKIRNALKLYCFLYIYGQFYRRSSPRCSTGNLDWVAKQILEEYPGGDAFKCLIGDSLLQLSRLYTDQQLRAQDYVPDAYMHQFSPGNWKRMLTGQEKESCSKEFYNRALELYVNQGTYRPVCWESEEDTSEVDAFTDLGFFHALYKMI